ncbi:hypothetical protein Ate01nite_72060 [Actinoplanes teichomyceticus]|nr:hypothetical protein Ate01nite_72060 [Actinoplanes teichomyceticus]
MGADGVAGLLGAADDGAGPAEGVPPVSGWPESQPVARVNAVTAASAKTGTLCTGASLTDQPGHSGDPFTTVHPSCPIVHPPVSDQGVPGRKV